jgi:hypothetical protein
LLLTLAVYTDKDNDTFWCATTNTQHEWVVGLIGELGQWTLMDKELGRGLGRREQGEKERRGQEAKRRKQQGARTREEGAWRRERGGGSREHGGGRGEKKGGSKKIGKIYAWTHSRPFSVSSTLKCLT